MAWLLDSVFVNIMDINFKFNTDLTSFTLHIFTSLPRIIFLVKSYAEFYDYKITVCQCRLSNGI